MGYHKPVLLHESIEGLDIKPKGSYVDLTFGGGGHSREVLKRLGRKGRLLAFDQDQDAAAHVPDDGRITFVGTNFRYMKQFLRYYAMEKVDGILGDLGISSHQIDTPQRGFTFREVTALDMRMDPRSSRSASQIVNDCSRDELVHIFRTYGELKNAPALAEAILGARDVKPLETTDDLLQALAPYIPGRFPNKFLARVFQALRIEVNREMESLGEVLMQSAGCMNGGGRLVMITYHSIEDRMVKNYMRSGNLDGSLQKDFYGNPVTPWKLVNRNVIAPTDEEIRENNRARSAKLRIAERIEQ